MVAARCGLASAFLLSGVLKLTDFGGAIGEIRALTALEPAAAFAAAVIAVQLGGGAMLLVGGRAAQLAALLLGGFTLVATLVAHDFWNKTGIAAVRDATTFFEHMGLIGGFALVWVMERGPR